MRPLTARARDGAPNHARQLGHGAQLTDRDGPEFPAPNSVREASGRGRLARASVREAKCVAREGGPPARGAVATGRGACGLVGGASEVGHGAIVDAREAERSARVPPRSIRNATASDRFAIGLAVPHSVFAGSSFPSFFAGAFFLF